MKNKKFQDPCFWVSNNCPKCGHSGRVVYTPDLLIGPIESECLSVKNPLRKFSPCYYEWSFAADDNKKDEIRALLQIAKRQEELWEEYQQNRIKLGYNK